MKLLLIALVTLTVGTAGLPEIAASSPALPDGPGDIAPAPACKKYDAKACTRCPGDIDRECKSGRDFDSCTQTGPTFCPPAGGQCDQYVGVGSC